MFYCCSCERRGLIDEIPGAPFTDIEDGLYISLFEAINELRESDVPPNNLFYFGERAYRSFKSNDTFMKKITYSIWVVNNFLTLAFLPLFKENEINPFITTHPRMIAEILYKLTRDPMDKIPIIEFYQYLTNEFTKYPITDDKQYLISASATKLLCIKYGKYGYDGVVYPSVRCGGNGINFAISPHVIDKGWLRCVELGDFQLICKDSSLLLENIRTRFKYNYPNGLSLLERSMELNKSGKKEMINCKYSFFL